MIYYCEKCDCYYDEEDLEEKEICLEEEYGVNDLFPDKHYEKILTCPNCGNEDLETIEESEAVDLLNDLKKKLKKRYRITLTEFWNSKEKIAIRCCSKEKAHELLEAFNKLGKRWITGESYTKKSYYNDWLCSTCYSNNRRYGDYEDYKREHYIIYEFEDVDLDN